MTIRRRLNAVSMVAVGLASLAMLPACEGEDAGRGVPIQTPTEEFEAPGNITVDDTSKACTVRNDFVGPVVSLHNGYWGTWASCPSFCPAGSYTYGVAAKSQAAQGGSSDDTALNGVRLSCSDLRTGAFTGTITSKTGGWGSWSASKTVQPNITGNPFVNGIMRMESPRGGTSDDTAANAIKLGMFLGGDEIQPAGQRGWGDWELFSDRCPIGTAICGIQTKVEAVQGGLFPDNTALNGVAIACCNFTP